MREEEADQELEKGDYSREACLGADVVREAIEHVDLKLVTRLEFVSRTVAAGVVRSGALPGYRTADCVTAAGRTEFCYNPDSSSLPAFLDQIMNCNRAFALSCALLASGYALPDDVDGRMDPNCNSMLMIDEVEGIPRLVETHGVHFHVYPQSVPENFTGCQVVWLENGHRLVTTHYKLGRVTWIKGQEPKEVKPFFCVYEVAKLVENESFNLERCPKDANEVKY